MENQAFRRENNYQHYFLLQEGEDTYNELKNDDEALQNKLNSHALAIRDAIETLIEKESEPLEKQNRRARIVLNGIMDAAEKDNNPQICMKTRDILETFFDFKTNPTPLQP